MNCLGQPPRWIQALPRIKNRRQAVKAATQLQSRFLGNLTAHGATTGVNAAGETRPVTKVEKLILDTIKVGQFLPFKYGVERLIAQD